MKKYIFILTTLATSCSLASCSPAASGSPTAVSSSPAATSAVDSGLNEPSSDAPVLSDSAAQMAGDLDLFCTTLEKSHKNLYAHISKTDFENERAKIAARLPEMSDSDFYYSLRHLAALVGDSHTSMDFYQDKYKYLHGLPFAVKKFEDGWHLLMLDEENEAYLGSRLLAINDTPIDEVFERSLSIISSDNRTWAEAQFSNAINFAEALEYLSIAEKGSPIVLSVQDTDDPSKTVSLEMPPMTESEIMSANILTLTPLSTPQTAPKGIYSTLPLENDCYYIQYNQCAEAPDLSMADFTKLVSSDILSLGSKKVILDLRNNSGGNSEIIKPLFKELAKLKKSMDFKVYTLIGSRTFSSAVINAIQSKDQLDSTLVGSPTGGSVNSYGELKSFNLTYLPVTVYYSTKYFELINGYEHDSLYPDIEYVPTYEDYYQGADRTVERIQSMP